MLTLLFIVYANSRPAAFAIFYSMLVAAFILLFVLGGRFPASVETAISEDARLYFQAFYSHFFFYLFGAFSAFVFHK